jgi:hypothetical protein
MLKTLAKLVTPPKETTGMDAQPTDLPPFVLPDLKMPDLRAVERACARLFSTEDGRLVMRHLQAAAFMRAYGPDASDAQIRYAEGQRALVGQLIRLIQAGRGA